MDWVPSWVIDTNVLVSAVLTAGGNCDRIIRGAVDGKIRLAWSTPLLAEYRDVLSQPKFRLSPFTVASVLSVFSPINQHQPVQTPKLPDPDDEVVLGAALATSDRILVTGNSPRFPKEICRPVRIFTPNQAVRMLEKE